MSSLTQTLGAVLLVAALAVPTAVQAGDDKPTSGDGQASPQKVETSLGLTIDVVALPKQVDLPGDFAIAFRLTNPTSAKLKLKELELHPVEAPTHLEVNPKCKKSGSGQRQVEPKNALIVACELNTPNYGDNLFGFFGSLLSRWSLITMTPGDYQFVVLVEAAAEVQASADGKTDDSQNIVVMSSKAFPVHLSPTVWQAVLGSMLGALLMVLFWASSPKVQSLLGEPAKAGHAWLNFRAKLAKGIALWCGATVAASIAIFLTFRLKDASMPFTVSVNDFYGGLVIGLFGVVLTNTLAPKLFGTGDKTRHGKEPAGEREGQNDGHQQAVEKPF